MAHGIVISLDRADGHGTIVADDGERFRAHRGDTTTQEEGAR